jgi:cardiolipin synthase
MVILIIQQRDNPMKTIAWLLIITFFPLVGIIFYFYFGKNYRKEKIFSRKGLLSDIWQIESLSKDEFDNHLDSFNWTDKDIASKSHIIRMLYNSDKAILTEHNKATVLIDGKITFEHIINDLKKAQKHIHIEYYIIDNDNIGNEIRKILIQKAQEGLEIRVIYDDLGCWSLSGAYIQSLKDAGVQIFPFMPVRFPFFTNKINYRNHRKIIIIDGKIGFVGGMNIADRYISGSELGPWRDTHLKIEGEAVYSLQSIFLIDWYFVSKKNIQDKEKYFPSIEKISDRQLIQIVSSGPDSDWASIMQTYFSAIATAKSSILISTPYFLPNECILTALRTASLSGVDVKILLPEQSDSKLVHWSSFSNIGQLLDADIKIYLYKKGYTHSKLMIVDGVFCSIGTANMDIRSFDQNFEVNALIYDKKIAASMQEVFMNDIKDLQHINIQDWETRSRWIVFRESVARLFSPLL